jgi:hypothetical protein
MQLFLGQPAGLPVLSSKFDAADTPSASVTTT